MATSQSALDSLLRGLDEGTYDSTGTFPLDSVRARELLRQYQLADPHHYVLCLVAWAVSAGADSIHLAVSSQGLGMVHNGHALSPDDLKGIFSSLLIGSEQEERKTLRYLALALNAALHLAKLRLKPTRS